jgi:hypothetical protein
MEVGYTLVALRCDRKAIIENKQLANSNWQLAGKTKTLSLIHTDYADQE